MPHGRTTRSPQVTPPWIPRWSDWPGVSAAPVAEHSGLYAEIHDSLLAALDADER